MISSDFGTIRIFTFFKNSFWLFLPLWTFPKSYSQRIYFSKGMVFFFLSFWLLEKKTSYISLSFLQLSQRGPLTAICCSQLKRMLECLTVELLRNICDCHNEGLFSTSCDNWYLNLVQRHKNLEMLIFANPDQFSLTKIFFWCYQIWNEWYLELE